MDRDRNRLDESLVERGLAESRSRARALIMAGDVLVNGATVMRAGSRVGERDELIVKSPPRYVSRGGEKLEHAHQELLLRADRFTDFTQRESFLTKVPENAELIALHARAG